MTRTRLFGVRAVSGIAALSLAATGLAVIAASPAVAAPAVVYDSIPAEQPSAYVSLGFSATSTSQFGDLVQLDGDNRRITDVVVSLTSWGCETGGWNTSDCVSGVGATFDHPITLNLYNVDRSGADVAAGDLVSSTTRTMTIPFRPSTSVDCPGGRWQDDEGDCFNGIAADITFDDLDVLVGNEVIVGIAYNTHVHGADPMGTSGPWDSLNVSLADDPPTVGVDETADEMFWQTTYPGYDGTWAVDSGWSPYNGLVMRITADNVTAIDPLTEVTVYERDVKENETPSTYTEWHEGNPSPSLDNSVVLEDGLHLGLGHASTVIKGTDLSNLPSVVITRDQLRTLIERASVKVVSGNVTYQIPVFFGDAGSPSFTTLRSTGLTAGDHSFSQGDTWATTQAFGPYGVHETAPLGQLIDALFDAAAADGGGVALAGYGVQADSAAVVSSVVWDDTRYTFMQPVIEACVPTVVPEVTNLSSGDWDFSQTRTQGSNEFTENGLIVTTFDDDDGPGSPDQRKAAGYHPIDIALSEVGSVELDIAPGYTGVRPSLQLGFDADGDGTHDAYLVGEPWAYGGGAWTMTVNGDWADAEFWVTGVTSYGVPAGGGYPSMGTLDEYLLANPEARILSYGYSLGSGVVGSATIESITVGCVTTPFGFELETLPAPTTERLSGPNRYATAVEISKETFDADGPDTVFIATGAEFADALSAAPAAALEGAPLLLTQPTVLPAIVSDELVRLNPTTVIIVGGPGAVSTAVENAISALPFSPTVERVWGDDRYETSQAIAEEFFTTAANAFVATGRDYPDALAAGPAAAELNGPVILVPGNRTTVDAATLALLSSLGTETVYVAGGVSVVSQGIEDQLEALPSVTVDRLSGDDRYATAIAINDAIFTTTSIAFLATGQGFADALGGGAAAANLGSPLYISPQACLPANVMASIEARGVSTLYVLGGPSVLSLDVENLVICGVS